MYRDLVLESAERVFARHGYHTSKMQDIAAEAGISLNTLYTTFPGKSEIFEAMHESRGTAFLSRIQNALAELSPARDAMERAVLAFVDFLVQHTDYFRVDLREGRSWAIGDVEASPSFRVAFNRWRELMCRGIEEGVFFDEDPELMATTAFGIMQVQLAVRLAQADEPDVRSIAEQISIQLERALCRPEVLSSHSASNGTPSTMEGLQ